MEKKAFLILANGFEEIEAIAVYDILKRANINIYLVSITGEKIVRSTRKMGLSADFLFEEVNFNDGDIIILPGGMPGSDNIANHDGINNIIQKYYDEGKKLAAICAAPLVFGRLNLLNNKNATCYPGIESELKGATISEDKVVVSENIITSKGPGTAVHFALKLVEELKSKEISDKIKKDMLID
ncbi:MAG: DJ-1/PfpI family protein [Fusobacteria bacterium]|nr:DJ-1/PfpI family protein [Fusobacteriota bacterium]